HGYARTLRSNSAAAHVWRTTKKPAAGSYTRPETVRSTTHPADRDANKQHPARCRHVTLPSGQPAPVSAIVQQYKLFVINVLNWSHGASPLIVAFTFDFEIASAFLLV